MLHGGATAGRKKEKRAGSPWVGGAGPLSYPRTAGMYHWPKARFTIQKLIAATRAAAGIVMLHRPGDDPRTPSRGRRHR